MKLILNLDKFLKSLNKLDFLGLTSLRLYLFYVFYSSGTYRIDSFDKLSSWIGSLNLPFPDIFTWTIIVTEMGGALLLIIGLFTRWACVPLIVLNILFIYLIHLQNGWAQESNGVEMPVTYIVMLLILLLMGGGKFLSLDYWIAEK